MKIVFDMNACRMRGKSYTWQRASDWAADNCEGVVLLADNDDKPDSWLPSLDVTQLLRICHNHGLAEASVLEKRSGLQTRLHKISKSLNNL